MPNISDQELKRISDALKKATESEKRNRAFLDSLGPAIVRLLQPTLDKVALSIQSVGTQLNQAISQMKVEVHADQPQVNIPEVDLSGLEQSMSDLAEGVTRAANKRIPAPRVSMPTKALTNEIRGVKKATEALSKQQEAFDRDIVIPEYTNTKPMPVMMFNALGKPWEPLTGARSAISQMLRNESNLIAGFGSGTSETALRVVNATDIATSVSVSGFTASVEVHAATPDGDSAMDEGYDAIQASIVRVTDFVQSVKVASQDAGYEVKQVSGFTDSVNVVDAFGSTGVSGVFNADNRLNVELPATTLTAVTDITNSVRVSTLPETLQAQLDAIQTSVQTIDNVVAGSEAQVDVVSGTLTTVTAVTDITNSVRVSTLPETIQTQLDAIQSATEQDNKAFEVRQTSGFTDSVFVTGFADSATVHEVMTTNKTAKADGADIRPKADDLGRQLTRPIQVRDLIATAYVSIANGTETTLLAAAAGVYHDCIMITATNNSSVATQLDIRAVTAGNIVHTMYLPATTGPVGWAPAVPWPQDATGNNWTIDMPDQTGTTVYVSALFSKEV